MSHFQNIEASSRSLPTKQSSTQQQQLMTRRQYTDPLGSDEDDDENINEIQRRNSAPPTPVHTVLIRLFSSNPFMKINSNYLTQIFLVTGKVV